MARADTGCVMTVDVGNTATRFGLFEMDADGLAKVAVQPVPAVEQAAREAAENCPAQVIHAE